MIRSLLGLKWQEAKAALENQGLSYRYQISRPGGKMEAWGDCRVIRIREINDCVEVVLVHEKFSLSQK